MMHNKDALSWG